MGRVHRIINHCYKSQSRDVCKYKYWCQYQYGRRYHALFKKLRSLNPSCGPVGHIPIEDFRLRVRHQPRQAPELKDGGCKSEVQGGHPKGVNEGVGVSTDGRVLKSGLNPLGATTFINGEIYHSHGKGEFTVRVASHYTLMFSSPSLTPSSPGMVGFTCAYACVSPARPPLTPSFIILNESLYTSTYYLSIGDSMQTTQHYGKPELLEVRQVKQTKQRRSRAFSWSRTIPSYNRPFYSTFEVYLLKPDTDDLNKLDEEAVFIKFQNSNRYVQEKVRLKDFMVSPFYGLLDDGDELVGKANELNMMRFNKLEELRGEFDGN